MNKIKDLLSVAKGEPQSSIPENLHVGWSVDASNIILIRWCMIHDGPTLIMFDVFNPDKIAGFNPDTVPLARVEMALNEYLKTHKPTEFSIYSLCTRQFDNNNSL